MNINLNLPNKSQYIGFKNTQKQELKSNNPPILTDKTTNEQIANKYKRDPLKNALIISTAITGLSVIAVGINYLRKGNDEFLKSNIIETIINISGGALGGGAITYLWDTYTNKEIDKTLKNNLKSLR
ncbi:MAG: hypothetical protein WCK67_06985 [bacterium]